MDSSGLAICCRLAGEGATSLSAGCGVPIFPGVLGPPLPTELGPAGDATIEAYGLLLGGPPLTWVAGEPLAGDDGGIFVWVPEVVAVEVVAAGVGEVCGGEAEFAWLLTGAVELLVSCCMLAILCCMKRLVRIRCCMRCSRRFALIREQTGTGHLSSLQLLAWE